MASSKKRVTPPSERASSPASSTSKRLEVPSSTHSKGKPEAKPAGPARAAAASKATPATARPATTAKAPPPATASTKKAGAAEPAAAAASVRRKLPKGGPSKADSRKYRALLLERRRALLSSSKELAAGALQSSGGEFSVDHMADHGSDNYEQDFNLKLLEGEADRLVEIRDALAKIDGKGELPYGLCERCADVEHRLCETCPWIPLTRLDAIPQARLCVQMQEKEEAPK